MTLTSSEKQASDEFDVLFDQHWERLCGVLYRLLGDPAEAQDLALEAFLRLYRQPPRSQANLGGWLYRVAVNLGFNALRARKRRTAYEGEAALLAADDQRPADPAEDVERSLERERVRQVLRRMKPRSARLLLLRHSGFSYAEVAEMAGVSPSSVGTLLARAERDFERLYRAGE